MEIYNLIQILNRVPKDLNNLIIMKWAVSDPDGTYYHIVCDGQSDTDGTGKPH